MGMEKWNNLPKTTQLRSVSFVYGAAAAKALQSCLTLWDPKDGSPPGSPFPGILQARTLEWVAISFSNAWKWKVWMWSCSVMTLSNPVDCSLPGSSVHGIFQASVLEWGAIAFSMSMEGMFWILLSWSLLLTEEMMERWRAVRKKWEGNHHLLSIWSSPAALPSSLTVRPYITQACGVNDIPNLHTRKLGSDSWDHLKESHSGRTEIWSKIVSHQSPRIF